MAGRVEGKIALITGAARGQGRSHAIRLAEEGADIIAIDACEDVPSIQYPMATVEDLQETVAAVEALGRRIVTAQVDVRDRAGLETTIASAVAELGGLHVVVANAGVCSTGPAEEIGAAMWQEMIDINLTGVWNTVSASLAHLRSGTGGSIIITSSIGGLKGLPHLAHYVAAKHGTVGIMKGLAVELAPEMIRVNSVHPTNVNTDMIMNDDVFGRFAPDLEPEERTLEAILPRFTALNQMPVPWVESIDVSNAVLWLASEEARYVTGVTLPIDCGSMAG